MTDGPGRVERLLNLLACLLDTRRPIAQEEIVRQVAGYPPARSAYRRAFERDKETLRGMGVPIRVEPLGPGESELGYRVVPDEYYLGDLGLTPDETAALNVAVNAVALGSAAGQGALMKLGGLLAEAGPPLASLPLVPALPSLFDAFRRRAPVTFSYRGRARTVEPWGLVARRGHWYLVGHDRDREAVRTFRADRIAGEVVVGADDDFAVPPGFAADRYLAAEPWQYGDDEPVPVRLLVDAGHTEGALARVGADAVVEERPDGAVVVEVPVVHRAAFRSYVLGFLDHAEVLGPPDVRAEVAAWLAALAGEEGP